MKLLGVVLYWWCFAIFGLLLNSPLVLANPMGALLNPNHPRFSIKADLRSDTLSKETDGSTYEDRYYSLNGDLSLDLYRGDVTKWFMTAKRSEQFFGQKPIFVGEDHTTPVDAHLYEIAYALGFRQNYSDDSALLFAVDFGSASDQPFKDSRDTVVAVNFIYGFEPETTSQWLLFINYSNNRTFLNNVPLPGVAYIYRPTKAFSMTLGIPFFTVNYFNFPTSTFNIFLAPSAAGYDWAVGILGPLQIFNKFVFSINSYKHDQRIDDDDRVFFEEKTAEIGLRSPVTRWLSLSISGGYSFERFYYEGENMFDPSGTRQRFANDWFLKTSLNMRF